MWLFCWQIYRIDHLGRAIPNIIISSGSWVDTELHQQTVYFGTQKNIMDNSDEEKTETVVSISNK